jgi:hypothetical protein
LEPGALYKYIHIGQNNRKTFLNYFSSNSILQITNWSSDKLKYDYEDAYGIVYFNTNNDNYQVDYLKLDGTNHVLFPATTKLLEQYKLTVSLWINVKDWSYIEGSQIFGNYYNSGYGLINESSVTTPIITLVDKQNNKFFNLNYKFSILNAISANAFYSKTNLLNISPQNECIQRLNDFNYWVFDKKNKTGIKFDIDNNSTVKVNFTSDDLSYNINQLKEITQIEVDGKENIYFYDNTIKKCVSFNTYGVYLSTYNFNNITNRVEIDLNGNLIGLYGTHSVIDNYNNAWEIVGGNLYKNKKIFGNIGIVEQLTCDAENNIWILHDQDSITKIDTVTNKVVSGFPKRISKSSLIDPCYDYTVRRRYLNFIRAPRDFNSDLCETTSKTTEDRLVLLDKIDNQIYVLNQSGDLIIKLNLLSLSKESSSIVADGDCTGYSFLRKFSSVNKNLSWKIKIADPNGKNQQLLILPIQVDNLSEGWHNFSFVFDSDLGYATSYIDTLSTYKITFEPKRYQIFYNYRTSLLIGAESVKNTILNDIIDINNGYKFVGEIAELRVYNKTLTNGEIEQIYYSSPLAAEDRDLIWNINTGERSYVEEIAHWFKLQLPGSKSKYYNINIHNFPVTDEIKIIIENSIRENIYKISPAQTELYKINWI